MSWTDNNNIVRKLKVLKELYFISEFWDEEGTWFVEVDSDQGYLFLQLMGFEEIKKLPHGVTGNRVIMKKSD